MSILVYLEVESDVLFPVDNPWGSKVASGFLEFAWGYCDYLRRGSPSDNAAEMWETVDWFRPVAAAMKTNLCVLGHAWYGSWPYRRDQFDLYVAEFKVDDLPNPYLTQEHFLKLCQEIERKWTDIRTLRRTVDALVDALEQVQPPETWWYFEPDTPEALAELSDVLSAALEAGYTRVRLTSR